MTKAEWTREIETGDHSIRVGAEGVTLGGPGGVEELSPVDVERLYQALVEYREHSGLNWEWARQGSGWWK